jgi:hypothetical protein
MNVARPWQIKRPRLRYRRFLDDYMKTGGILSRLTGDVDTTTGLLQMGVISPAVSLGRLLIAVVNVVIVWYGGYLNESVRTLDATPRDRAWAASLATSGGRNDAPQNGKRPPWRRQSLCQRSSRCSMNRAVRRFSSAR